jgi:hypothetical protein
MQLKEFGIEAVLSLCGIFTVVVGRVGFLILKETEL